MTARTDLAESKAREKEAIGRAMIEHLRGRDRKLEPLGWTGPDAEWIALVCLHSGVFTRAQFCHYFDTDRKRALRFVKALVERRAAVEGEWPIMNGGGKTCRISHKLIYRALGVEAYWIDRVKDFFAAHPFKIRLDASRGLRTVVRDVVEQAVERQKESGGTYYAGAVLQHLVGAKLDCALGQGKFEHNSFSTADAPGGRAGDFFVGDVVIHVTTSPSEAVIERCRDNLNDAYRPMLVTMDRGLLVAQELAKNKGIEERIDIFEIEQFVALNLYELGQFEGDGRRTALADLVTRYNDIVEEWETDPSLKIELKR